MKRMELGQPAVMQSESRVIAADCVMGKSLGRDVEQKECQMRAMGGVGAIGRGAKGVEGP